MENGKRKTENVEAIKNGEKLSAIHYPLSVCAACGTQARRETASFCLICGKSLDEDYQPLDTLRSSYHLQGKSFLKENAPPLEKNQDLFGRNKNPISQTAYACLVYSFVPYLGILFVPFTFGIGGIAYLTALRQPESGGRKLALMSIVLSFAVLAVQLFLWWLLYVIPELK